MEKTGGTYIAWGLDGGTHEARGLKPMLTPEEQVALLKAKGVRSSAATKQRPSKRWLAEGHFCI